MLGYRCTRAGSNRHMVETCSLPAALVVGRCGSTCQTSPAAARSLGNSDVICPHGVHAGRDFDPSTRLAAAATIFARCVRVREPSCAGEVARNPRSPLQFALAITT